MRRAERQKAGSHTAHRSSSKTDDHTRDGEPPALRAEGRTRGVGRHRFHFMRRARGDSPRSKQWRSHARVKHSRRIIGLESCAYEARSAFEGRPVRVRFAKASRGENDGVGIPILGRRSKTTVSSQRDATHPARLPRHTDASPTSRSPQAIKQLWFSSRRFQMDGLSVSKRGLSPGPEFKASRRWLQLHDWSSSIAAHPISDPRSPGRRRPLCAQT